MKDHRPAAIDPARRAQMALVRGENTKPEMKVRRALHAAGLRFRLHARELPGRPDIVFRSRKVVVFVHGCFWHRHSDPTCKLARMPKSRGEFWKPKLEENAKRDTRNIALLESAGWTVEVVWECGLKDKNLRELADRIRAVMPVPNRPK